MLPSAAGCLDAPPEYSVPDRIPPVVVHAWTLPELDRVHAYEPGDLVEFRVPFRADDQGEPLRALFFRDLNPDEQRPWLLREDSVSVPADERPFAEQDLREVVWTWTVPEGRQGCRSITMVLAHLSNFLEDPDRPQDELQAARVTWWFDILDPEDGSSAMDSCPGRRADP